MSADELPEVVASPGSGLRATVGAYRAACGSLRILDADRASPETFAALVDAREAAEAALIHEHRRPDIAALVGREDALHSEEAALRSRKVKPSALHLARLRAVRSALNALISAETAPER